MNVSAEEISRAAAGLQVVIRGDPARRVHCVRPLSDPVDQCLTYAKPGITSHRLAAVDLAGCIVVCTDDTPVHLNDRTFLLTANPRLLFMRAVAQYFMTPQLPKGIHPTAVVDPSAKVDPSASIGAYVVIGADCRIEADVILYPHVTLYSGVSVGTRSIINSGTVVGADGFGYERNDLGVLEKFPHVGGVRIGADVEIGSNTSIDRGTLGDTVIEDRVRIDNQCHISHNVRIGADSAVIAQSMLGGSVTIGPQAWIAPAATLMNQVKVGAKATVGMGAVVVKDIAAGCIVTGSPAVDIEEFRATRRAIKCLVSNQVDFNSNSNA